MDVDFRVARVDLWRYCTWEQCREMLLSFKLLGENQWEPDKVFACLYELSNHAERHYERVRIPKRSGGFRTLSVPDSLLKYVQRNLLRHVLEGFSVSDYAAAYHKRENNRKAICGVVENGAVHRGQQRIMKLDIEDFFGNITFPMVLHHAFPVKYFPLAVGNLLASLCCCRERLPQGAPTSPAISNLVMKPFDQYMAQWCGCREIVYSRYCDDLTFSGDFDPGEVLRKTEGFLGAMGFELNRKKTRVLTRGARQIVTGLVVNDKVQPSKEYRRKLRQDIYYCRKYGAQEHLKAKGEERRFLLPDGSVNEGQYFRALLGKVQYVGLTRPEDGWLREAEQWLREKMREKDSRNGIRHPAHP